MAADPYAPPASIARPPEVAASTPAVATPQGSTELLSPVDSKFYSVPTGQVDAYLRAGYARPIGRDVAHARLLKQYSGWSSTLAATGLGFVHGVPLADAAIEGVLPEGAGKAYAETSRTYAEANPFATGVGTFGGGAVGLGLAAAALPEVGAAEIGAAGLEAGAEGTAEYTAAASAAREALAQRAEASYAAKTLGGKALQHAGEAAQSGAINAGVGAANQIDENALNHALDPEGHEKLQMSMGGLLADFALGAGAHVGLTGVGKIFKGAGHGIEYVAGQIRGKGLAAEAEAGAATGLGEAGSSLVTRETSPLENGVQPPAGTPPGQSTEGSFAGAPETAGETGLGPKPLSAAAQRIEDIKAAQAEAANAPIDPNEPPSVRTQRLKDLQTELERQQAMSEDEIIAKHANPSDLAAAEAANKEVGPLHNQEYGEEAIDRLEEIRHLQSKEQVHHLKGEQSTLNTLFAQAEHENATGGRSFSVSRTNKLGAALQEELGTNSDLFKNKLERFLLRKPDVKAQARLRSLHNIDGSPKTEGQHMLDMLEASTNEQMYNGLSLRGVRNMRQELRKHIDWDSTKTSDLNDRAKRAYKILQEAELEHFKKVGPGEITGEQYAAANKQYSINQLARRAIGQQGDAEGAYARIVEQSRAAHEAQGARLEKEVERANTAKLKEDERLAKAKARVEAMQGKRLKAAEQQKAREDYQSAVRDQAARQKEVEKAQREVEAQKAKTAKAEERVKRQREAKQKREEAKAEREKDRAIQQQQLNEQKFGHVVHAGIAGAIAHGMKGSLAGMALSGGMALLRGIPKARWAQVGDQLAKLFKGVDKTLARTVEAGLYGIPAEVHNALDPNDYPKQVAKVMAARNGPQNAYTNLAKAHLDADMPDELAVPLTQKSWSALQDVGKAVPATAGPPGVYSEDEPDLHQKLVWMGQLKTVEDPTYGIANPTPENVSILKAYYPRMFYNSQQAAILEVQQNPNLPLEGKLWASALCGRPLTTLATSQFLGTLAGARQQSEQHSATQNGGNSGNAGGRKVQSSMSRMDALQNQDA